jgi:hypothetical protein
MDSGSDTVYRLSPEKGLHAMLDMAGAPGLGACLRAADAGNYTDTADTAGSSRANSRLFSAPPIWAVSAAALGPMKRGMRYMLRSHLSELHKDENLSRAERRAEGLRGAFGPSPIAVLSLPLLSPSRGVLEALPPPDTESAGSTRAFAGLDLQLQQRNTGTPQNLHPLYGEAPAAHLQSGGDPTIHRWGKLPSNTTGNRRIGRVRKQHEC